MSILLLRRFNPFSTRPTLDEIAGEIPETEVDIVGGPDGAWAVVGDGRLPPALSTDFKSLDSTLSELPVDSLVMVTEPPLPELEAGLFKEEAVEDDALLEEVVEVVKEAVELGEPEVCLLLIRCPPEAEAAKPDDWSLVTMLDIELLEEDIDETDEDFTGEMVTLLLLLSFLWGELEPNKRPSSSSTLSKVEESIVCLLELLFTVLLESSLVLKPEAVRLFKSTKSLGFNMGILWLDSDKLGRGFLALGSSVQASIPLEGCPPVEAVFTIEAAEAEAILNSPPLTPLDDNRSRLRDSPVALLLALLLCILSVPPAEIFGPMSTNLTLQVVLGPVLGVEAVTLTDDRGLFSPMPSRLLSVVTRFTFIIPKEEN